MNGGASVAVLGGQVGKGDPAFGVAAADGAARGLGQFGLLAFELAVLLGQGHAFAGALVSDAGFELGEHGEGLEEQSAGGSLQS